MQKVRLVTKKSSLSGRVRVPASKSHTVRAVAISSLADGKSIIRNPLVSSDTLSAVSIYRAMGAQIETGEDWIVVGTGGKLKRPEGPLDVGNSGTTLYIAMGSAALLSYPVILTGDNQIQNRPADSLIEALKGLGVSAGTLLENGKPPVSLQGPIKGGNIELDGSKTSQYLTSLLMACPLAKSDTIIQVKNLTEAPYIQITLNWLDSQGIQYKNQNMETFHIPGNQEYHPFDLQMPGDFSSATFFLCAAAITGSDLLLEGLDMNDPQGDKAVVEMLSKMGAKTEIVPEGIHIQGGQLHGATLDLNATPDALPALAVAACFAKGETRLVNVQQARLKETDRIQVMAEELTKMGVKIQELPDGLVIQGSPLHGAKVCGHGDHRVIMALAFAGLAAEGITEIDNAKAISVTFPNYVKLMQSVGADMREYEDQE